MGSVTDLFVYAIDLKEEVISRVPGDGFRKYMTGKKGSVINFDNSVEVRGKEFSEEFRRNGIDADMLFLTTQGMYEIMPDGNLRFVEGEPERINFLYSSFNEYYAKRMRDGAHMHDAKRIRRR